MLTLRILTACVLIPLVLWLLFYASPLVFLGGTVVLLLLASWEWSRLLGLTHLGLRFVYFYLMCLLLAVIFIVNPFWVLAASVGWWCIAFFLVLLYPRGQHFYTVFIRGLMGVFVLIPCVIALNVLRAHDGGVMLLFYLLTLIWIADIAAYFVGKQMGTIKLAPLVSPGKTVQGAVGAMLATFIYSLVVAIFYPDLSINQHRVFFVGLSLLVVMFSVLGDLFESLLKREVGIKDSGNLLPGHGGLLDRIDSLTAAAPIFVLGMLFI